MNERTNPEPIESSTVCYATLEQCRKEVALAEEMFRTERLPNLSTTHTSIEEIASKVLAQFGIQKHMF